MDLILQYSTILFLSSLHEYLILSFNLSAYEVAPTESGGIPALKAKPAASAFICRVERDSDILNSKSIVPALCF